MVKQSILGTDPYAKVDSEIARLNKGKLKSLPIRLCRVGGSLYVQGTFPPKLGEKLPKQRRVPLKLRADIDWMFEAKNRAIKIGSQLLLGEWEWELEPEEEEVNQPEPTTHELIQIHRRQYLDRNGDTHDTLLYWKKDFLYPFNKLPPNLPPTIDLCKAAIANTPNNTRTRTRYVKAYRQLLDLAGIEGGIKLAKQRGNYQASRVQPREIPDETAIVGWGMKVPEDWKFYYFLLACFGLRGTEAHPDNCKLDHLETGEIMVYAGKTKNWRYVPSCSDRLFKGLYRSPKWAKTDRTPGQLSEDFCKMLRSIGCEFTPYALRHHYAYFTLLEGWDTALSARYMGHSIALHQQTYWLCIDLHREREIRQKRYSKAEAIPPLSFERPSADRILDSQSVQSAADRDALT